MLNKIGVALSLKKEADYEKIEEKNSLTEQEENRS